MRIIAVAGARPHFVKLSALLPALEKAGIQADVAYTGSRAQPRADRDAGTNVRDDSGFGTSVELGLRAASVSETEPEPLMTFFGVEVPAPRWFLDIGVGTNAVTTGRAMRVLEPLFEFERPDAVIVVGDVNASLAAAVSAAKAGLPVVHLDSGLRSGDMSIAEEINRVLISRVAALHLTPSETALTNLEDEAIEPERIVFVGNVTAESVIKHMSEIRSLDPSQRWGLAPRSFVLAAFHQRENIGVRRRLTAICEALTRSPLPVVWVVNEQVRTALEEACISLPMHVNFTEAIGYREMLAMQCDAAAVLTDSSGVQQEACMLHTPCVTVLHATEQTETIEAGANRLAWANAGAIGLALSEALVQPRHWPTPKRWDAAVSQRVVRALKRGVTPLG